MATPQTKTTQPKSQQPKPPHAGARPTAHRPLTKPAGTPPPSWEDLLGRR